MSANDGCRCKTDGLRPFAQGFQYAASLLVVLTLAGVSSTWAARTQLKPGWNMFSPQQDIEMGQQVSRDAEQKLQLLNDARVDNYLNNLGRSLAGKAPGERYPYQFKCVNDRSINAFALPGGFVYVNRGLIEAADNEAQLAGVIAHETSHVALRHGSNQASKASVAKAPLGILSGVLGSNSVGAALAQLGAGFATDSILLKYSRTDESQADIMGTQILFDSGYDPRAMAQFFTKIQAENKGGQPLEFFSSHPNPDHRIERVDQEIGMLGGARRDSKIDSPAFQDIKRSLLSRSAPTANASVQRSQGYTANVNRQRSGLPSLQILTASYGAKDRFSDIRQLLQSRVQNNRLNLQVTNASMGGDPIANEEKTLRISYAWAGRTYEAAIPENQMVSIPTEQQLNDQLAIVRSGTSGLQILTANYGAKDRFSDVRQLLQSRVQDDRLNLQVTNASMGGDPIANEEKTLRISYAWAGRTYEAAILENQMISIPTEQQLNDQQAYVRSDASGLQILTANYGAKDRFVDVRQLLQSRVQNDRLNLPVTNASMGGDPIEREAKTLRVSYAWAGRTYEAAIPENQLVSIPTEQQLNDQQAAVRINTSGLQILTASYGAKDKYIDVRQLLQSRVQNDRLNLQITNAYMGGDPIEMEAKTLRISYAWAGNTYDAVIPENQMVSIPAEQHLKGMQTFVQNVTPLERTSNRFKSSETSALHIEYPDNWQVYGQGDVFTVAPRGGLVNDGNGNATLAYGAIVNIFEPDSDQQDRRLFQSDRFRASSPMSLQEATDKLVQGLQQSNRNMRVVRQHEEIRVGGERALSAYLSNDSPMGGRETDWLVTLGRPGGLLFIILKAPDQDFSGYQNTFQQIVNSVRIHQ